MTTDAIRWRAIREANTVPGSSDPAVWTAAYKAAVIALSCEAIGRPLAPWQWRHMRELLTPGYRCPTVELRAWGRRRPVAVCHG